MRDRIHDLVMMRPEMQFSRDTAKSKVQSLFGNRSEFAVGMGLGQALGKSGPAFMNATHKFGRCRFLQQRMGG